VLITTLTPSGGAAIAVISQPGASVNQGDADLMNTRCTNVLVAERPARTCLDTISFSVSTTVVGSGRTYIITSNRRRGDQQVYNRVLASFRILQSETARGGRSLTREELRRGRDLTAQSEEGTEAV